MTSTTETKVALAELAGAGRTYGEGTVAVHALRDVDLRVEAGELLVVLGPSGSGKTTLLNVLGGIESATSGRVRLAGQDLAGLDAEALTAVRRFAVGFVFQYFNLIPTLTARENVAVIAELTGRGTAGVERALADVGLADRADHFPAQLSGGQQQRVAIARALVTEPRLLLCDEPTGALDLETGRQVLALLRRVVGEQGRTVVIVTHNQAITGMADRVIRMRSGEIVEDTRQEHPTDVEEVTW